jgi:hypothetical protein
MPLANSLSAKLPRVEPEELLRPWGTSFAAPTLLIAVTASTPAAE